MEPTHIGDRTVRLRAEELTLETTSVRDREALVARDVVSTTVSLTVPLLFESVRIEERTLEAPYREATPIDEPVRLVVRLSREETQIARRSEAYERVTVGVRAVEEIQRVSAPLAHEELAIERFEAGS